MTSQPQLADLMRESSQTDHQEAEDSSFIAELMTGKLSLLHYQALLAQYAYLYAALDSCATELRSAGHFSALLDARLERSALMLADLAALGASTAGPLPSMVRYVERIRNVSTQQPHRYLAHHYVRFLGDLSGGQILARKIQQHYGAGERELTAWDFTALGKLKPYKDRYRGALNELQLTSTQVNEVLDEVRRAFGFNKELFQELSTSTPDPALLSH
ncbi:heme oxygenase (biliverdin-producing) [Psychromicrobium lacuslunae]|uniref:biliverdin-producing heme oxygenase n=1 Tax=Psychromicrobium lacuslunae TaxID=1618207 RepID=UPI000696E4F9|nr:biliverdin-producing heme oxygenase [Psychromicrobium lacuslunae]